MYIDKQGDPAGGGADAPSRITFRLDPASGVPTYLQLGRRVKREPLQLRLFLATA